MYTRKVEWWPDGIINVALPQRTHYTCWPRNRDLCIRLELHQKRFININKELRDLIYWTEKNIDGISSIDYPWLP